MTTEYRALESTYYCLDTFALFFWFYGFFADY